MPGGHNVKPVDPGFGGSGQGSIEIGGAVHWHGVDFDTQRRGRALRNGFLIVRVRWVAKKSDPENARNSCFEKLDAFGGEFIRQKCNARRVASGLGQGRRKANFYGIGAA
jgi:hypothetical protein